MLLFSILSFQWKFHRLFGKLLFFGVRIMLQKVSDHAAFFVFVKPHIFETSATLLKPIFCYLRRTVSFLIIGYLTKTDILLM